MGLLLNASMIKIAPVILILPLSINKISLFAFILTIRGTVRTH